MNSLVARLRTLRVTRDGQVMEKEDDVALEVEVSVAVGDRVYAVTTSPYLLRELGLGLALGEGYDVSEAEVRVEGEKVVVLGAEPRQEPVKLGDVKMRISDLFRAYEDAQNRAELFRRTGCFHYSCAVDEKGRVVECVEDISRHCALDKLLGTLFSSKRDVSSYAVILSSRATRKLVAKAANAGVSLLAFRGAPTLGAVEEAAKRGVSLVAFLRSDRMNIYTGSSRLLP